MSHLCHLLLIKKKSQGQLVLSRWRNRLHFLMRRFDLLKFCLNFFHLCTCGLLVCLSLSCVMSLSGFGIKAMLASQNELGVSTSLQFLGTVCLELILFCIKCLAEFTHEAICAWSFLYEKRAPWMTAASSELFNWQGQAEVIGRMAVISCSVKAAQTSKHLTSICWATLGIGEGQWVMVSVLEELWI